MRILIIVSLIFSIDTYDQSINSSIYNALSDSSNKELLTQIEILEKNESTPQSKAYLGSLYMRQADFLKPVSKKIERFKEGRALLEKEIQNDPEYTEYHFLRLIIQENAPSILKYYKDIEEDVSIIYLNFSKLNSDLKEEIMKYSLSSLYLDSNKLRE